MYQPVVKDFNDRQAMMVALREKRKAAERGETECENERAGGPRSEGDA